MTRSILFLLLLMSVFPLWADEKQKIKEWCRDRLRGYESVGDSSTKADRINLCVNTEILALNALSDLPKEAEPIISRCVRQNKEHGWTKVRTCVEEDLKLESALADAYESSEVPPDDVIVGNMERLSDQFSDVKRLSIIGLFEHSRNHYHVYYCYREQEGQSCRDNVALNRLENDKWVIADQETSDHSLRSWLIMTIPK